MIITDQDILRQVSREISKAEVKSLNLEQRIRQALPTAWTPGVGLAAIQINEPVQYAWYSFVQHGKTVTGILLNPMLMKGYGEEVAEEGCLSIPNYRRKIKRFKAIDYISNGKKKTAYGFEARIIQHEWQHFGGILICDKTEGK